MRLHSIAVLAAVASCTSPGPAMEERREWRRASMHLQLLDVDPNLGQSLRVTLDLRNAGTRQFLYDDQDVDRGSFDLVGPDGCDVPFIGWIGSRTGVEKALAPGSSTTLLYACDLSSEYLIDRPGRYRLRFSGRGLRFWKPEEAGPGDYPVRLVSDWVEIQIGEGTPTPAATMARRLRSILPEHWRLCSGSFERGSLVLRLLRSTRGNRDEIFIQIGGAPNAGFLHLAEGPWGSIWLLEGCVVEEELRPAILAALTCS